MFHRDGSIVQTQITLDLALEDQDFAIAVVENITLRAALEEQLRRPRRWRPSAASRAASHTIFNNVLTVVSGHAELLREDVVGPQGQEDITVYLDAVRRASDLTRQLLAFSRLQELESRRF